MVKVLVHLLVQRGHGIAGNPCVPFLIVGKCIGSSLIRKFKSMCHVRSAMTMGIMNRHTRSQKIAGKSIGFPLIACGIPHMGKNMVAQFVHQGKTASSGRRTATPGRKTASSGRNPNNSVQAGRKNTNAFADNTSKITLSSTFLHVRKGEAFSLHATAVTSQNYHLNWEFSSSGFLKKSSVKSRKNSSDITLTANRTGMVIVTCRTKENWTISCSCTIKITE